MSIVIVEKYMYHLYDHHSQNLNCYLRDQNMIVYNFEENLRSWEYFLCLVVARNITCDSWNVWIFD